MAKSKIDVVRENLDKIREYKSLGMRDEDIYKQLGISRSAWYDYIKKNKDISEAVKGGTTELVFKLKGELVRQAFKHSWKLKSSTSRSTWRQVTKPSTPKSQPKKSTVMWVLRISCSRTWTKTTGRTALRSMTSKKWNMNSVNRLPRIRSTADELHARYILQK